MNLTDLERTELARCAKAMYAKGCAPEGRAMDAASKAGAVETTEQLDALKSTYRAWLVFNEYPAKSGPGVPYPEFCSHPEKCVGHASCQRDPNCID